MKTFKQFREEVESINEDREPIVDYADGGELGAVLLKANINKLDKMISRKITGEPKHDQKNDWVWEMKKFGLSVRAHRPAHGELTIDPNVYENGKKVASFDDLGMRPQESHAKGGRNAVEPAALHALRRAAFVFPKAMKKEAQKLLDAVRAEREAQRRSDAGIRKAFAKSLKK